MQLMARLPAAFFSLYVTVTFAAQEDYVRIRQPNAPAPEEIMRALALDKDAQLFARILTTSELTQDDFESEYVTFMVPRDATCTVEDRDRMAHLTAKDAARTYVLKHAFEGSLSILTDIEHDPHRVLRAVFFPERNAMNGGVTVDESHPLSLLSLSGDSVLLSLRDGRLYFGARSTGHEVYGVLHGAGILVDQCGVF